MMILPSAAINTTPLMSSVKSESEVKVIKNQPFILGFTDPKIMADIFSKNTLPTPNVYQSSNEKTVEDFQSVNSKLSSLDTSESKCMVDIFSLMKLFNESGRVMKESAFMQRESSFQQQTNSLREGIDEMKKAASARLTAGLTSAVLQGAGAVAQIGLSAKAFESAKQGSSIERLSLLKSPSGHIAPGQSTPSLRATQLSHTAQAAGTLGSATGSAGSAIFNNQAELADGQKAVFDLNAKTMETATSRADEAYRTASEIVNDTNAKMKDLIATEKESMNNINRNII
jgi:hypothetical protein